MIGKRLGHYEILEKIGEGGMGEVYRAHDTKLDRDVAIKTISTGLAPSAERLARFQREARAVAALNHPNIVTIYSIEEIDGILFLSMELIEGQSLSRFIGKDGLSLERFFELSIALTDALAAAHSQGITHRDIKPSNIIVGKDGRLKVLDFGLAKLRDLTADSSQMMELPTVAAAEPVTAKGEVLGTATYMSPEQAEGKPLDHRSDIFSLGVVLYEMATGARPFHGDTPASLISSILRDDPPSISQVNRRLPRHLGRIVKRCLAKDVQRRFQTALDVRNELAGLKLEWESGELGDFVPPVGSSRRRRKRIWQFTGAAALVLVLMASAAVWQRSHRRSSVSATAPHLQLTRLTDKPGFQGQPCISPDGKLVAFVDGLPDNRDIYLQRVGGERVINLTPDFAGEDWQPSFSPDGARIAFRSEREGGGLYVMGTTGESPRRVSDKGYWPAWSPDGKELAYCMAPITDPRAMPSSSAIWRVNLTTGAATLVLSEMAANPDWSPHTKRIAYWMVRGGQRDLWTMRPDGSDPVAVTNDSPTDWRPVWSADGNYLYFISDRGGTDNIWRIAVDEESGKPRGEPEPVTSGTSDVGYFDITPEGHRLVFAENSVQAKLALQPFDARAERLSGAPQLIMESTAVAPDLSPDGKWIVYMTLQPWEDILIVHTDGSGMRHLTHDEYRDRFAHWSPKGDLIAFFSNRGGKYEVYTIRPDGSDLRKRAYCDFELLAPTWSPDATKLVCFGGKDRSYIVDLSDSLASPQRGTVTLLPPMTRPGGYFVPMSWTSHGDQIAGGIEAASTGKFLGLAGYSPTTGKYISYLTFTQPQDLVVPEWLDDGRRLIYAMGMEGNELRIFDTVQRVERKIETPPVAKGEWRTYNLADRGAAIFEIAGTFNVDVWLADVELQ